MCVCVLEFSLLLPSFDQDGGDRGPPGMEPDGEMEVREEKIYLGERIKLGQTL